MEETILILDFGSQYTQLIARRVRELNVYCEIYPCDKLPPIDDYIKGVILSGSPFSVYDDVAPKPDISSLRGRFPMMGICYGAQYLAQTQGGEVEPSKVREYGRANLSYIDTACELLKDMTIGTQVWMSHGDAIQKLPDNYSKVTSTRDVDVAGFRVQGEKTYGIQFHPEVYHTVEGLKLLENFVVNICGCSQSWTPASFIESTILSLKKQINNDKVVLGLSGGVDSSVAATLLHKAIGENLHCIFVDNGLLRKDEFENVLDSYKHMGLNVKGVDAKDSFYSALEGISDPESKRKAIGRTFIEVFDEAAHEIQDVTWLAQGTIYPDVIESVSVKGPSATIKSHHNVGGLPEVMKMKIIEPLNALFKDEVRKIGRELDMPENILGRHPFPGPGLGIRIIGEVSREKVRILQDVDALFIEGLKKHKLYDEVWQAFAVLLPVQSVGVMGDERTYENVVVLRAVGSTDGMTADWSHLPYEFLSKVSNEIINKVRGVNRVVYDISSKPPSTIEWE
jgi:GMP synthase (glutamine-hydrolysing)